jgi:hypothetical protein
MSRLSTFFKESDESFGVFYPNHYIMATFRSFGAARKANQALRNAGFAEDEVLAVTGPELLEFLKEFRQDTGVWGEVMTEISRFFDTEARKVDDDVHKAEEYCGFLAAHAPTDTEKAKIVELVKPLAPSAMRWYLPTGIDNLV